MSLEENKAIVRRLIEAENKRKLAFLDELMVCHYVDNTLQLRSLKEYKQMDIMFFNAFPDFFETIEDIIAEGDKVWGRIKCTGTHKGEYRGLAPTGKKITIATVLIWHIVDGKVVDRESIIDWLDFYKQLGVIEYTEKGKKLFPEDVS